MINFPDAPTNNQLFSAPNGVLYKWLSATNLWIAVYVPGAATVFVGDAPPPSPAANQLWWSSALGELFVSYNDGNSVQWVPATPGGASLIAGTATLQAFGAKGDGVTNDTAAILQAFAAQAASGIMLEGNGLTYGITSMAMTASKVWIENCTFKDLAPTGAAHWMIRHDGPTTDLVMKNVTFNRNGDGTQGDLSSATLLLQNVSNVLLEDMEVYGNNGGIAIKIENATNIRIIRPYIHDMNWERAVNPGGELVEGIFIQTCNSVLIDGHLIKNLTGTVLGVPQDGPAANYRNTDGISIGGSNDVRVVNGFTYTVGEGVDITGSIGNTNVRLENNTYYDCAGYSEKLVHGAHNCSSIGGRYYRSGIAGFVVQGGSASSLASPANITAVDCVAYDTGSNGLWQASQQVAGFLFNGPSGGAPNILNVWLINCKAYSTTQEYGIRNGGIGNTELHVVNFDTTGATVANYESATFPLSEITAGGRFSFTNGVDVATGGATITAGNLGIGVAAQAVSSIHIAGPTTGASSVYGVRTATAVASDVTVRAAGFRSNMTTANAAFTLTDLIHFLVETTNKGAASTITNIYGIYLDTGAQATNNYGIYNALNIGTGRWFIYGQGTAASVHSGLFRFGSTVAPVNTVDITGSFGRGAPVVKTADFTVAATENWLANNKAAATCTVTLPAAATWPGREIMLVNYQAFTVVSASANVVPLTGAAAAAAILPATAGSSVTLVSDGTNWRCF